jgi:hypothetical protein
MDEDELNPIYPKEDEEIEDLDDELTLGKKKPKKVSDDDLVGEDSDSLDELADAEIGEDDEPYDDVDKW